MKIQKTLLCSMVIVIMWFIGFPTFSYNQQARGSVANADVGLLPFLYGDAFTPPLATVDDSAYILPSDDKYRLIVYLAESCGSCYVALDSVYTLSRIFESDYFDYLIIWDDVIPENLIARFGLSEEKNVRMEKGSYLSRAYPFSFILAPDQTVYFHSNDLQSTIDKLFTLDILTKDDQVLNANKLLEEKFIQEDKAHLLYFYMTGCPDCAKMDEVIQKDTIQNLYEVIYLYRSIERDVSLFIDKYSIFRKVYDVVWYPSFLLMDENGYQLIGEMSQDELETMLIEFAN